MLESEMVLILVNKHSTITQCSTELCCSYQWPWDWLLRFLRSQLFHCIVIFFLFFCHEDVLAT